MVNESSPEAHAFEVTKSARYFTLGPLVSETNRILIALHGYGQLPEFFIRKLQFLAAQGWAVIAPEGLHRFYVQGTAGRVGASWMTKEDRESDIRDYVIFLDALTAHLNLRDARPVLLGFSQGVATASRWVAEGNQDFSKLILWSGVFPPDFNWNQGGTKLKTMPVEVALGDNDPFFKEALLQDTASVLDQMGVNYRLHRFAGGHSIDEECLQALLH